MAIAGLIGCRSAGNGFPDFKKIRTFNPTCYPHGNWNPADLHHEEVWFCAADGTRLHGWYVPHENPRAVVLYCHGNSGNLSHRANTLRALHDDVRVSVFIFDYRGYGRSQGTPSEEGILADGRAARACLAALAGVEERDIVLLGHALGSGVAVDLAARGGAKALVLESAFTSVPDVGASYFPWLPVRLVTQTNLDSLHKIGRYQGPLLQSHGDADTIVPYRLGRRLYRVANQPKEFLTLPGHDHMDPLGEDYYRRLAEFLDNAPRPLDNRPTVAEANQTPPDEPLAPTGATSRLPGQAAADLPKSRSEGSPTEISVVGGAQRAG